MKEIPQEQRLERYDTVPQSLRNALNSEVIDELLQTIGEVHHLGEERTLKMTKIFGLIILGFIHPQDLQREISSELNIDKRLVDEIAHELQIKILNPLLPEINAAFNYHITGIPAPSPTPPFSPPQPETVRPSFAPPQQEIVNVDREARAETQPFILHEERADVNQVRPTEETLMRPDFYEAPREGQEEVRPQRPMVARLEIGGEEILPAKRGPQREVTEAPEIRVVHYSPLQTPVDPFGNQAPEINNQASENDNRESESPKDIHPENVVDLKDLPK